jgi:hypothetical protein
VDRTAVLPLLSHKSEVAAEGESPKVPEKSGSAVPTEPLAGGRTPFNVRVLLILAGAILVVLLVAAGLLL